MDGEAPSETRIAKDLSLENINYALDFGEANAIVCGRLCNWKQQHGWNSHSECWTDTKRISAIQKARTGFSMNYTSDVYDKSISNFGPSSQHAAYAHVRISKPIRHYVSFAHQLIVKRRQHKVDGNWRCSGSVTGRCVECGCRRYDGGFNPTLGATQQKAFCYYNAWPPFCTGSEMKWRSGGFASNYGLRRYSRICDAIFFLIFTHRVRIQSFSILFAFGFHNAFTLATQRPTGITIICSLVIKHGAAKRAQQEPAPSSADGHGKSWHNGNNNDK